ncbi:VOC family protein [Nocardioides marmoriginsengisoli]|uniref:VOC family protein n=1 Tax=Nocardioides marmoriginsengisoli TaxID=661483 RepID=UPI001C83AD99|nr:VOC family protein [Nocardioides marmoriginsengisoli]
MVEIEGLLVADPPEAWAAAGFAVDPDGVCRVGGVRIRLVGRDAGTGIVGWSLRGVAADLADLDGVPSSVSDEPADNPAIHPNGATGIDHVVLLSPDLRRTVAAFEALGVSPRRERDGELGGQPIRQIFFRLGAVVVEVIGSADAADEGPSSLWGITYDVQDIDAIATFLGERTSPVKDAVQPGRRITTLRHRDLGMSVRTALISPRPPR